MKLRKLEHRKLKEPAREQRSRIQTQAVFRSLQAQQLAMCFSLAAEHSRAFPQCPRIALQLLVGVIFELHS